MTGKSVRQVLVNRPFYYIIEGRVWYIRHGEEVERQGSSSRECMLKQEILST